MENLYAVVNANTHKCKIINLVWNEVANSFSIYNISKNNIEMKNEFKTKEEFINFLERYKSIGLIDNYYEIEV